MLNEKISVILPIYGVEKYLDECMEHIVNQTYQNLEIIMIDDGSKDNCPKMCDEWARKDSRIRVIHKKNAGLGFARNSGLEIATGKYVVFIDSDDFIDNNMIQVLYEQLIKNKADTVYCGINRVYNNFIEEVPMIYGDEIFQGNDIRIKILYRMLGQSPERDDGTYFYMSVWHALYSMDLIKKNNIKFFSEREFMCEDIGFHIQYLFYAKKVVHVAKPLYYYRLNIGSLSTKFDPNRFERIKKLYIQILDLLEKRFEEKEYKDIVNGWFLSLSRGQIVNAVRRYGFYSLKEISKISHDSLVQKVYQKFPYYKNPFKRRIFNFLVYKKLDLLTLIAVKYFTKEDDL